MNHINGFRRVLLYFLIGFGLSSCFPWDLPDECSEELPNMNVNSNGFLGATSATAEGNNADWRLVNSSGSTVLSNSGTSLSFNPEQLPRGRYVIRASGQNRCGFNFSLAESFDNSCLSNLSGTYFYRSSNFRSGTGGNVGACGSELIGSITLSSTSTVGSYTLSDASFGLFACAYAISPPGGNVLFTDNCGKVSMSGADRFGDTYSLVLLNVDGSRITFNWSNSYGDGGTVTLTRTSGNWPIGIR